MLLPNLLKDLRYAARGLWRDRVFTGTTVATLAVALALVTVVFAIFNAYVLRPYSVRDPWSLYELRWQAQKEGGRTYSWHAYQDLRERTDMFEAVAAERHRSVSVDERSRLAAFVSGNYFETLGGRVQTGRILTESDAAAPGAGAVAVLSFDAWTRFYDRDPAIVGRAVRLNDRLLTIVGVMHEEFGGVNDTPPDFWVPVTMYEPVLGQNLFGRPNPRELAIIVRLRNGVGPGQAAAALGPSMGPLTGREGEPVRADLFSLATPAPLSFGLLATLSPVFAAFALVLVAACANVSNVMLARAFNRRREIGIRLSLGASRPRVVLQLFAEGLVIAAAAGALGIALAQVIVRGGTAVFFLTLPPSFAAVARVLPLDFDYRVFVFALLVAASTTLMFALVPALQGTRTSLTGALRNDTGNGAAGSRLRSLLVVGQVTVSLILIVIATTLARNSSALEKTDPGFPTASLVSIKQRTGVRLLAPALETLAADPRIASIAATSHNPLTNGAPMAPLLSPQTGRMVPTSFVYVSPEYFPTVQVPIVAGRGFTADEAKTEAPVAIVSVVAARTLWPDGNAIGQTVRVMIPAEASPDATTRRDLISAEQLARQGRDVEVIGIAASTVVGLLYDGRDAPHVYMPTSATGPHARALLARGRVPQDITAAALSPVLRSLAANPLTFEILTLTEALALQRYPVMAASWIGLLLSAIALILSVSGLYGVVAYGLSQRQKEIGIRMALGATSQAIVRLVLSQSGRLVAIGAGIGLLLSFSVLGALRAMIDLKNISLLDPVAFAAGVLVIATAAAAAAYVPSRRATRIDPSEALRMEGSS
jgi:predicted permease